MARPYTKAEREVLKKEFIQAMEDSMGMLTTSCRRVGITKETISNWREKDADFDQKIKEIYDRRLDFVEGELFKKIREGNTASILFYLKCRGGYKETKSIEVEQKGQLDVDATIDLMKEQLKDE